MAQENVNVCKALEGLTESEEDVMAVSDPFRMYYFKVVPCAKPYFHDRLACPFTHSGEKARRRDPRTHKPSACASMKRSATCALGDQCPFAHNIFEFWLHPSRYRTELCHDGARCNRKLCFFAHSAAELRAPTPACDKLPSIQSIAAETIGLAKFQAAQARGPSGQRMSLDVKPTRRSIELPISERRSLDAGYTSYMLDQTRTGTAAVVMPMRSNQQGSSETSRSRRSSVDSTVLWQALQQSSGMTAVQQVTAMQQGGLQPSSQLIQLAMQELAEQLLQQPQQQPAATATLDIMSSYHGQQRDSGTLAGSYIPLAPSPAPQLQLSDPALTSHMIAVSQPAAAPQAPPAPAASPELLAAVAQMLQENQSQQEMQQPRILPFCRPPGLAPVTSSNHSMQSTTPRTGHSWPMHLAPAYGSMQPQGPSINSTGSVTEVLLRDLQQGRDWQSRPGLSTDGLDYVSGSWAEEPDRAADLSQLDSLLAGLRLEQQQEALAASCRRVVPMASNNSTSRMLSSAHPSSSIANAHLLPSYPNVSASGNITATATATATASHVSVPADTAANGSSSPNLATWATAPSSDEASSRQVQHVSTTSIWQEESCEEELSTGTWGNFGVRAW